VTEKQAKQAQQRFHCCKARKGADNFAPVQLQAPVSSIGAILTVVVLFSYAIAADLRRVSLAAIIRGIGTGQSRRQ
jgi:hypothetical protein